jgi:hypothetical protein
MRISANLTLLHRFNWARGSPPSRSSTGFLLCVVDSSGGWTSRQTCDAVSDTEPDHSLVKEVAEKIAAEATARCPVIN